MLRSPLCKSPAAQQRRGTTGSPRRSAATAPTLAHGRGAAHSFGRNPPCPANALSKADGSLPRTHWSSGDHSSNLTADARWVYKSTAPKVFLSNWHPRCSCPTTQSADISGWRRVRLLPPGPWRLRQATAAFCLCSGKVCVNAPSHAHSGQSPDTFCKYPKSRSLRSLSSRY